MTDKDTSRPMLRSISPLDPRARAVAVPSDDDLAREAARDRLWTAALAYGAAHAAEAEARETWMAAIRAYAAIHPSPSPRKGSAAYERWQAVMHRAVKVEHDAYDAAREATKHALDALHAAYAAHAGRGGGGGVSGIGGNGEQA